MIIPKRTTEFPMHDDGDVRIFQKDARTGKFTGRVMANYGYRPDFLIHAILFHIQSGQKVPHRDDWKQYFFRGVFSEPTDPPQDPLLRMIMIRSKEGALLTLAKTSKESSRHFEFRDSISGEQIAPRINARGDLVYTTEEGKTILKFPPEKAIALYHGIITPMTQDIRGQRRQIGEIYSCFPFEAYELQFQRKTPKPSPPTLPPDEKRTTFD